MSFRDESDINETKPNGAGPLRSETSDKVALAVATCGGLGRVPLAPGTVGTLAGIPLWLILQVQPSLLHLLSLAAWIALAVWSSDRAETILDGKDPQEVVIDEVVGVLVTMAFIRMSALSAVIGFVLFRLFDILKPPPIRRIERKLPGGLGIVADDLLAGVYAHISLRLLLGILKS